MPETPTVKIDPRHMKTLAFLLDHGFEAASRDGAIVVDARLDRIQVQAGDLLRALRGIDYVAAEGDAIARFDPVVRSAEIALAEHINDATLFPEPKRAV